MASVGHVSLGITYKQAGRMRTWHGLHIYAHSLLSHQFYCIWVKSCTLTNTGLLCTSWWHGRWEKRENDAPELFSLSHMFNDMSVYAVPPPPKERGHCVYTLTNRKWCQSLSPGRLRRLLRYRDSGFLFLSFFLSPAFTWTHTDRH